MFLVGLGTSVCNPGLAGWYGRRGPRQRVGLTLISSKANKETEAKGRKVKKGYHISSFGD